MPKSYSKKEPLRASSPPNVDLTEDFGETNYSSDDTTAQEIVQISSPSASTKSKSIPFDEYASRCFIIERLDPISEPKTKTDVPGVTKSKKVFNVETFDPLGNKRIITVWEENALKTYQFFL